VHGEGPYTKLGAIAAVVALVLGYLLSAAESHWWPFRAEEGLATPAHESRDEVPNSVAIEGNDATSTESTTSNQQQVPATDDPVEFVLSYYRLMPDTTIGWQYIGPDLRLRGRDSYERFWSRFDGVEVQGPPSVSNGFVSVRIVLYGADGSTTTEHHVLGIVPCGEHLCIDSDQLVG
jgi:hypothetical protein